MPEHDVVAPRLTVPVPPAGGDTIENVVLFPSTSVPVSVIAFAVSSGVEVVTGDAAGASFDGVTVMVNICGALVSTPPLRIPPSSWTRTVTVAEPNAFGAGVNVSVPVGLTAGCTENNGLLLLVTMKSSAWLDSFAGPLLSAVAQPENELPTESSATVLFAPLVKLGTSFTGFTVMFTVATGESKVPSFTL